MPPSPAQLLTSLRCRISCRLHSGRPPSSVTIGEVEDHIDTDRNICFIYPEVKVYLIEEEPGVCVETAICRKTGDRLMQHTVATRNAVELYLERMNPTCVKFGEAAGTSVESDQKVPA